MHCIVAGDIIHYKIAVFKWNFRLLVHPSISSSVCMYRRSNRWTDLSEIWYWRLLWKSVGRKQICSKSDKNIDHTASRTKYFIVAGDIKSLWKLCCRLKWYRAVRRTEEIKVLREPPTIVCYRTIIRLVHIRSRWKMHIFVTKMRGIKLSQRWMSTKQTA